MTMMTSTFPSQGRFARWLLIVSLAINLFFIGTAGALALRHYLSPAQATAVPPQRTAAARIERLAFAVPPADAEKLRASFRTQEAAAERAREALNRALERLQAALRRKPFDRAELAAALLEIRTTRPVYEQVMGDIYLNAVAEMSSAGRPKLADWPLPRPPAKR